MPKENREQIGQVYRFGDRVAIHLKPCRETLYLSRDEACDLFAALADVAASIQAQPDFSKSTIGTIPLYRNPFNSREA